MSIDIICTIGPASSNADTIQQLIREGMTIARINLSHATQKDHQQTIQLVRDTAKKLGKKVAILADLQGPKIRLGEIVGGEVELQAGKEFILHTTPGIGNEQGASVDYEGIVSDVKPGSRILLNDGAVELVVKGCGRDFVDTRIVTSGTIGSHKGVNLPGTHVRLPALTEKDKDDLRFLMLEKVDAIGCSFVREASDVDQIRQFAGVSPGHGPKFIAKIETIAALKNFTGILQSADGIMVARGDMGVEVPYTWIPFLQKAIVYECNRWGKYVITATQMLQSMVEYPMPTRAEVTDIFQAVLDGSKAVMLSAESASGQFPVESVQTMNAVSTFAELIRGEQPFNFEDVLALLAGKIPVLSR
ncbi:pyruvate kinase [Brevibacillus migulae]|uniref:pyruvate kinase n=1 Tax=Brevibacillus migulae TaxID=1644114 RepID=UPI00106E5453|nr:pyruvate kinase [Brevibacillus migulae]